MEADSAGRSTAEGTGGGAAAGQWIDARPSSPGAFLAAVAAAPVRLFTHRALIVRSVRRDLASQFAGTVLGRAWPVIHPLLFFAIYYFIFTRLLGMRMIELPPEQSAAMGVYMFVGILIWTAFGETLARSMHAVVDQGNLIRKVAFPSEVLPLNVVLVHALMMLIGVGVFVSVCAVTSVWTVPGLALVWIGPILLLQLLFTAGLAWTLAALNVFLRDTRQIVSALLVVWMLVTPIFWVPSVEVLPSLADWLPWVELNPVHHLVYAWRHVLLSGEPAFVFDRTTGEALSSFAPWALGSFFLGYGFFHAAKPRFADEV